jgi:hypothetical protein
MREGLDPLDIARLLALQNLSEADASINCWNDKYHWDFWRPWNAIPRSGGRQSGHGIRPHLCAAGDAAVRHFDSFSQVLDGILEAPIWAGLHFRTSDLKGKTRGRSVARYAAAH